MNLLGASRKDFAGKPGNKMKEIKFVFGEIPSMCCARRSIFSPRCLGPISKRFANFETEELALYGDVEDRLRKAKIAYDVAYHPECVPSGQL